MKRVRYKGDVAYHVHQQKWTKLGDRNDPATWALYRTLESRIEARTAVLAEVAVLWLDRWDKKYQGKRSAVTRKEYARQISPTGRLMGVFGHMTCDEITIDHLNRYVDEHPAPISANREISLLGQILKFAIGRGYRKDAGNPALAVELNEPGAKRPYFTTEAFKQIYDAAPRSVRIAMTISYLTGLRLADVLAIRKEHVEDGMLKVTEQKTGKVARIVMSQGLREAFAMSSNDIGPVVHTQSGKAYTTSGFKTMWRRAKLKAGYPDQHFHDCRRKHATDMDEKGLDAQLSLGHTSGSMTARYINHQLGRVVEPLR